MNLIPNRQIYDTGNYFCTWGTQGEWYPPDPSLPTDGCVRQRNGIDQRYLFAEDGVLKTFPEEIRQDLLVLLDDGWDVPYGTHNPRQMHLFGSICPDPQRFSNFGDTPQQRLFGLSRSVRESGFAGLGLWIATQYPRSSNTCMPVEVFRRHFEQAAQRCAEADVRYWKVDWGWDSHEYMYRQIISQAARQYAPRVLVEQTSVIDPLAVQPQDKQTPQYQKRLNTIYDLLPISDYFRTYDVMEPFDYVSTLMRLAVLFAKPSPYETSGYRCIPNVEHVAPIGAVLGCSYGLMHHPMKTSQRLCEMIRALHWQRFAPPFGLHRCINICSAETLTDTWLFREDPHIWPYYGGSIKEQTAPARFSRGAPLPQVHTENTGIAPFVAVSKHPDTGAYAVGTFPRTLQDKHQVFLPAQVQVFAVDAYAPVGIFGIFDKLTLVFDREVAEKRILVQDLADWQAHDVTEQVSIQGNKLSLPGTLLTALGSTANGPQDLSAPGMVLRLV